MKSKKVRLIHYGYQEEDSSMMRDKALPTYLYITDDMDISMDCFINPYMTVFSDTVVDVPEPFPVKFTNISNEALV